MTAETSEPLTREQAIRWARLLHQWGFYGLRIVETYPEQTWTLKGYTKTGAMRCVTTHQDFINLRQEVSFTDTSA